MMLLCNQISIDLEDICVSLLWRENVLVVVFYDLALGKPIFLLNKVIYV